VRRGRRVIGLSLERGHAYAVGLRGRDVDWGLEGALSEDDALADALMAFLASLPVGRWRRPPIAVALGSVFAQTKRLVGLPPALDDRVLAQAVREHVGRFFLKNGVPLALTAVRTQASGVAWAAALDQPVVDAVAQACRTSNFRLLGILPAVDVLNRGLVVDNGVCVWDEPGGRSVTTWAHGRMTGIARGGVESSDPCPVVPALASLGERARRLVPAYGAAIAVESSSALIWHADTGQSRAVPPWRLATATSIASLALLVALIAPGLSARLVVRRAARHAIGIAPAIQAAQRLQRENDLVTRALADVAAFDAERRPMTLLLDRLARALPAGTVLVEVHTDSVGGSVAGLGPRPADFLSGIEALPGVTGAEIVGPVASGRVTIRFRWAR
jgi:hypothetical protein